MEKQPTSILEVYFQDYERWHQNRVNVLFHQIGIPLVVFSALGILGQIVIYPLNSPALFRLDLGIVALLMTSIVAFKWDARLALPFAMNLLFLYFFTRSLPLIPLLIPMQILGWMFQLGGHFIFEKKNPAFFSSLEHLVAGPLWAFARLLHYRGEK